MTSGRFFKAILNMKWASWLDLNEVEQIVCFLQSTNGNIKGICHGKLYLRREKSKLCLYSLDRKEQKTCDFSSLCDIIEKNNSVACRLRKAKTSDRMAPSFELVVCITSTALFNCSTSDRIWKHEGLERYLSHQRQRAKVPLKPGVGFPLVQSLLALNAVAGKPLVEVVLVSRNSSEAGERVRSSIDHYKLRITRMSFTCGTDVTHYLPAWKCDLFLSTEEKQVRQVLSGTDPFDGIAAGLVCSTIAESSPSNPVLSKYVTKLSPVVHMRLLLVLSVQ